MKSYTLADGPALKTAGVQAIKTPSTMYFVQQDEAFTCTDIKGAIQHGQPGDYAAVDPVTGNVFMLRSTVYQAQYAALPVTLSPAPPDPAPAS